MTNKDDFVTLFKRLNISAHQLARRCNADPKTVLNWQTGKQTCPRSIMLWMQALDWWLRDNPAPDFQQIRTRGPKAE